MGRILYGVMGDGGGHISRSLAIAQRLRAHEIVFVGGERVRVDMARHGYATIPAPVAATELVGQRVSVTRTITGAAAVFARQPGVVRRLARVIREFDPDLILSDYEHFLPLAARRCGRPCVSVDRQHALTHCRYRPPPGHRVSRALTLGSIRCLYSAATRYLVSSFVPMEALDPDLTEVFPTVVRDLVGEWSPRPGDHAVVYVRGASMGWVRGVLGDRRRRYVVYGFDTDLEEGNLSFRTHSPEGFLDDLSSAAYLVSNGGHNALSEALHFGKPVLCLPTRLFYEQLVNAHLLARAGYGAYCEPDGSAARALNAFEEELPRFSAAAGAYVPWAPRTIAARLEELMAGRRRI
jgi:uncharacterized protein (TIGR00661 family)